MKFKKRITIEKEKKLEPKKKMKSKTKRRLFSMFLILVFASIPATVLQANKTLSKAKKINADTEKLVKTVEGGQLGNERLFSPLVDTWLTKFVDIYLTLARDEYQFKKRESDLAEYMTVPFISEDNLGINQKVTNGKLLDIRKEGDHNVALYKVNYHSEIPVKKEHEVEHAGKKVMEDYMAYDESDTEVIINIPYIEKNYQYKVVALPYFSSEDDLVLKEYKLKNPTVNLETVKQDEKESINKFVDLFLNKYVKESKEDMTFLMAEPTVLGMEDYKVEVIATDSFKKDDKYVVFLTYKLINEKTNQSHDETMSLLIKKRESNFYIEKATHYLGGITDEK